MNNNNTKDYAEEDLQCALEDIAYWTAKNLDNRVPPMIFRNDQVQEQYCKLVKEFRDE